jgi:hypothetical protein
LKLSEAGIAEGILPAVSASSSSPLMRTALVVACAFVLSALIAGCTVPGKERLAGTPDDMPPSLNYLSGDALGWMIVDTDPKRAETEQLVKTLGLPDANLAAPIVATLVDGDDAGAKWIGGAAGVEHYTTRRDEASRLTFIDVAHRTALEKDLRAAGWTRTSTNLDAGHDRTMRLWTRTDADKGELGAVGVADDALIGAATRADLQAQLRHTRRYTASERTGIVDYTIDALEATPLAVVVRSDQLRTDLRTLVSDSPALNEMSRWLTQASAIYALRDGWIGAVPAGGKRADSHVRVIGRMDWARAATQVPEPKPVDRPKAADLADADWAVAMTNPGSYVKDVVDAISDGGNEFVTDEDAPKGTPKLGTLLDKLDGQALVTREGSNINVDVSVDGTSSTKSRATQAIKLVGLQKLVAVGYHAGRLRFAVDTSSFLRSQSTAPGFTATTLSSADLANLAMDAAGKAPSKPVAWVYLAKSPCDPSKPAAGWIAWHSPSQRLAWSFDVPVAQKGAAGATRCSSLLAS